MFYETIDAVNEILRGEIGDDCDGDQEDQGGRGVHARTLDVIRGSTTRVGLDGQVAVDLLYGHGQDIGRGQARPNWLMNSLETGSRAGSGSGRPRRVGGRRGRNDVDEEMVV